MANLKLVKSATALVLGASVLTSAVAVSGTDASAKTTYKVTKKGTLVNAKTNKAVQGYKSYKGKLYKNGKKLTGTYKSVFYKSGVKFTGTYNKKYYVKGKLFTGKTSKNVYYKKGVKFTGVTSYGYTYKDGKRVEGEYQGKVYKNGKLYTGLYKDVLYTKGVKETGLDLYQDKLYKDGVLNVGYALLGDVLYKDAGKNVGWAIKAIDGKTYFDTKLANDTYTDANGVETAYENGVEVGAKVKSVEAINAKQIKVTFNKTVDAASLVDTNGDLVQYNSQDVITVSRTTASSTVAENVSNGFTGVVAKDGRSITLTAKSADYLDGTYALTLSDKAEAKAGDNFKAYSGTFSVDDTVVPTVESIQYNPSTGNFEINVSEPLASTPDVLRINGVAVSGLTPASASKDNTKFVVAKPSTVLAGSTASVYVAGSTDYTGNILTANTSNVTVSDDQSEVTLTSATQVSSNVTKLVFSKPIASSNTDIDDAITALVDGTAVNAANVTFTKDTTDTTGKTVLATFGAGYTAPAYFYGTAASKDVTFVIANTASNYIQDVYGKKVATTTKVVNMTKDVTGPTVSSTSVSKDGKTLVLQLNEALDGTAGDSVAIDALRIDGVDQTITNYDATLEEDADGNLTQVHVVLASGNELAAGTYTVRFAAAALQDAHSNDSKVISVNKTVAASTTDLVVVNGGITTAGTNHYTVEFNKDVTAASALNAANYTLDGAKLPEGTDLYFDSANTKIVHIVLPTTGSVNIGNTSTGTTARLGVSGVQTAAGQTVKSTSATVTVKDNTSASIKSVSLVGNTIFVKFDEALTAASFANAAALANELSITVDGSALTLGTTSTGTAGTLTAATVAGQPDTLQIVVSPAVEGTADTFTASNWNTTKTIAVSVLGTTSLTDANGYAVSASTAPVANK